MRKQILAVVMAVAAMLPAAAQLPVRWSVEAGWNISTPTNANETRHNGWSVGVTARHDLPHGFFVDAGLSLSERPWARNSETINFDPKPDGSSSTRVDGRQRITMNPWSLLLPVHVGYSLRLSDNVALWGAVGPYVGCGLWGHGHSRTTDYMVTPAKTTYETINDVYKHDMRRFDVGLDVKIGIDVMKHYFVSAGYQRQFNDFARHSLYEHRNSVFSVGVGYRF